MISNKAPIGGMNSKTYRTTRHTNNKPVITSN